MFINNVIRMRNIVFLMYLLCQLYEAHSTDFKKEQFDIIPKQTISPNEPSIVIGTVPSVVDCTRKCLHTQTCEVSSFCERTKKCIIKHGKCCVIPTSDSEDAVILRNINSDITVPTDCTDIMTQCIACSSGVYTISPRGSSGIQVYCESMSGIWETTTTVETENRGWTVIQKRVDGTTDFYRDWNSYKTGFGNVSNEYWIGNDNLNLLTQQKDYILRIELEDWDNETRYATYQDFRVSGEDTFYKLTIGAYNGTAGDSLRLHHGKIFSTFDKESHESKCICASNNSAGWWFKCCYNANLNGVYRIRQFNVKYALGWKLFRGVHYSLKRVVMMIQPE